MRVLASTTAGTGHFEALLPALGAVFGGLSGLSYDEGNRIVIGGVFASLDANAALPRLGDTVARWCPDVVVRDPAEFASWVVAESRGIPQVRVSNGLLSAETRWARLRHGDFRRRRRHTEPSWTTRVAD
jgi:hypothetical protein